MMHMNLTGYLFSSADSATFSRIRYYYLNFVDREAKTQQEYIDAKTNKPNLGISSPSLTEQFRFSHETTG